MKDRSYGVLGRSVGATAAVVALAATTAFAQGSDGARSTDPVEFAPRVIDADIPGGYAVAAVDVNNDGRLDVIGNTMRVPELAWYENPTWERHVMVDEMPSIVNLAATDLDGDGIPEVAIENAFAMVPANSEGLVWLLRHQGDPRERWREERIDAFSTSHHIAWADIDGDGRKELINGPLIGPLGLGPTYDQDRVPLFWYGQDGWQRQVVADDIGGILHRVRPVDWNGDRREELLTASFDGITLYTAAGGGAGLTWESRRLSPGHEGEAPRLGSSDVALGQLNGQRLLASVEPWHGNEIVAYTEDGTGTWRRRVLFSEMVGGHEVAVGDLDGDGRDDIVAGDRSRDGTGVHVLYAPADAAGQWHHQVLDAGTMSASGCVVADIDGGGRPDIVCIGGATGNIVWYENLGPR